MGRPLSLVTDNFSGRQSYLKVKLREYRSSFFVFCIFPAAQRNTMPSNCHWRLKKKWEKMQARHKQSKCLGHAEESYTFCLSFKKSELSAQLRSQSNVGMAKLTVRKSLPNIRAINSRQRFLLPRQFILCVVCVIAFPASRNYMAAKKYKRPVSFDSNDKSILTARDTNESFVGYAF